MKYLHLIYFPGKIHQLQTVQHVAKYSFTHPHTIRSNIHFTTFSTANQISMLFCCCSIWFTLSYATVIITGIGWIWMAFTLDCTWKCIVELTPRAILMRLKWLIMNTWSISAWIYGELAGNGNAMMLLYFWKHNIMQEATAYVVENANPSLCALCTIHSIIKQQPLNIFVYSSDSSPQITPMTRTHNFFSRKHTMSPNRIELNRKTIELWEIGFFFRLSRTAIMGIVIVISHVIGNKNGNRQIKTWNQIWAMKKFFYSIMYRDCW